MKNKINIILGIILVIGIISAVVIADTFSNTTARIDTSKLTALKDSVNLSSKQDLIIKYGNLTCDENECWSSVYYPDIIQTEWRTSKNYCSKQKEVLNSNGNITGMECETTALYSTNELLLMRDSWVKNRLEGYANNLISEKSKSATEVKVNEGTLTVSDK